MPNQPAGPDASSPSIRYVPTINAEAITALDVHVHVEVDSSGRQSLPSALTAASGQYFGSEDRSPSLESIAQQYRDRRMAAVVFTVDARTNLDHAPNSVEEIAKSAAAHSDVLIPFGSVDPRTGADAIDRARMLSEVYGVRGFKFHPSVQGFDPSDWTYYPLWEELQSIGCPVTFHTGQNGIGAGLPGGYGIKLKYSNPMLLDDVAGDFPRLPLIMAHPSVPWQEEAISIATHKSNVYIDLSGWSPKYFSSWLVRAAGRWLQDRMLFGTDFPLITPGKWLDAFSDLNISDAVQDKILKDNAVRLLELSR